MTMHERLARAMLSALRTDAATVSGNYVSGPRPGEPFDQSGDDDFSDFVVDGRFNGWKVIDTILAELRTPDGAMMRAWAATPCPCMEEAKGTEFFTAMIDSIRAGI